MRQHRVVWAVAAMCFFAAAAARAVVVRFGFDDPSELERWSRVSGQLKLADTWVVEHGVLKISDSSENSFPRVRNLEFHEGVITYRTRWVGPAARWAEAGVGYRVEPMLRGAGVLAGPPGIYVRHSSYQLDPREAYFGWSSQNPPPSWWPGAVRPLPFWDGLPFEEWHTVRIEVSGGEHRVFVGVDGDPRLFLRVAYDEPAIYHGDEPQPRHPWAKDDEGRDVPIIEEPGHVGILHTIDGGEAGTEVQFDDFTVDTVWPVGATGKTATTWAVLKSQSGAR